jgi:ribosome-binding protein aMBF1 (putative translation factor)
MTLADYLDTNKVSATDLAAKCAVSVSTITRAAKGEVTPSRDLMAKIFEETGGAVTPNDFFGIAA